MSDTELLELLLDKGYELKLKKDGALTAQETGRYTLSMPGYWSTQITVAKCIRGIFELLVIDNDKKQS